MMQRRSLKGRINTEDPGWPLVQEWIAAARNQVEVLKGNHIRGEEVLLHLQVTTRLPMVAIALETGSSRSLTIIRDQGSSEASVDV
ncbi:MAG TPA: DUF2625 family protein [Ktedonosporobacter sp.]|nr:DUF2625 family protein [Ktedonosporobacter sp.]